MERTIGSSHLLVFHSSRRDGGVLGFRLGSPGCVALTGLHSDLGLRLADRLRRRIDAPRLVHIGIHLPPRFEDGVSFHRIDLTDPDAEVALAEVLRREEVDVIAHLAFRDGPRRDRESNRELAVIGTRQVLNACEAAGGVRFVMASSTMCYGPYLENPHYLDESSPLRGHRDLPFVMNRVAAEAEVEDWSNRNPAAEVTVLRSCWVLGPRHRDVITRYLDRPFVPVPIGFDPLLQFLHEDDWVDAFETAICETHPGVFNVVGGGALPLSMLLALAGKTAVPMPASVFRAMARVPNAPVTGGVPSAIFDYLKYIWLADGRRAWETLGKPSYTTREAWISFVTAQRRASAGGQAGMDAHGEPLHG